MHTFFQLAVLALISVAAAAKLENVYLPPNARGSSGASAGLQAPLGSSAGAQAAAYSGAQSSASANAEILNYENEINEDGYRYSFKTSDGTEAEQQGRVLPGGAPDEAILQVAGSYSYVGNDGQTYSVSYTADENGFQARGDHLPTPPPIPEAILKSLQLTAGSNTLISVAAIAKLEKVGAGSQAEASYSNAASASTNAKILSYENQIIDNDYNYSYKTSDGTEVEQDAPDSANLHVHGSYSYVGDDGQTYYVSYSADENGFQVTGDHLPAPPPIPEAIMKSLQLTAGSNSYLYYGVSSHSPKGIPVGSPLWKLLNETKFS
ncbi:unnamed protein product [Diatraea saccharalis]|uniref:Uncharacterized protein n=1 Tax=Diatraea saccharalis TaxID=40085 RepID=A0A9N9WI21_9NEOP|nr:unnamed protein product [Diatraea saccharalis]